MSQRTRMAVVVAAVALIAIAALATTAGASQRSHAATSLKQVPGTLPGIGLATLTSPASASKVLEIGVGISRPDAAAEQALATQMYDSSSPLYHHFLTVSQFNQRFGVAAATTSAVRSFLTSGGLTITSGSAGGDYFLATGTVAQIDSLFKVAIGNYSYKGYSFTANNTAPSVPANLPIDGIAGLENLTHFSTDTIKGKQLAKTTSANAAIAKSRELLSHRTSSVRTAASGLPVTVSNEGTEQTYTAQDLWGFYNAPGASALTNSSGFSDPTTVANSSYTLGQGQIMGVFTEGEDTSVIRNLRLYENTLGLPKVPVRIVETEGTPDDAYSDNSGAVEWYLDSQSSTSMAPDAKQLDLFTAKTFQDADVAEEFDYWANDANGPREMNASFGECEENPTEPVTGPLSDLPAGVGLGGAMENLSDPFLRQAVLEGRTLFASAGDTGSGCPSIVAPVIGGGNGLLIQPIPFQNYPCISDYVVCVGGTTPSSKGAGYPAAAQRSNEQAWTYSGGGSSYFNPAPSFQSGISNINIDCVSNDLGTVTYAPGSAPLCRGVPDVADISGGGNDWFFFYTDGEPSIEGGTSLASPLMMGQWARVQAAASTATQSGGGLGFADPTIYKQASSADTCTTGTCTGTYARDFYDITQAEDVGDVPGGQTGVAVPVGVGLANGVYGPTSGWDYVSGWGALNDANFIQDVDGTTNAADAYSGQEQTAPSLCTASMTSPAGNATDVVTDTNDTSLDITAATLSTSGSNIVATLTVPGLSSPLPATSVAGAKFIVGWSYDGEFYYGDAEETAAGTFTYSAGNTGAAFSKGLPNSNEYSDTATITGTANTTTGQITLTIPASDVGSPAAGALLSEPQAFSQEELAILDETLDSADTLRGASIDDGQADSIGANVVMDGVAGTNCSNTLESTNTTSAQTGVLDAGSAPSTGSGTGSSSGSGTGSSSGASSTSTSSTGTVCNVKVKLPNTHITKKLFSKREAKLSGTAAAHCPDHVTYVGLAIAKTIQHRGKPLECQFLTARHKWTKVGNCKPRDYLKAKGTAKWSFSTRLNLKPGIYYLWEHAIDNKRLQTKNVTAKHVFLRVVKAKKK